MEKSRELTVPAFHLVLTLLGFTKTLIQFETPDDREQLKAFIEKWVEADRFRETEPRQFLQLFGEGEALFCNLPDYIRDATDRGKYLFRTPIMQALAVAGQVAYTAKIKVTFTENGTVFN